MARLSHALGHGRRGLVWPPGVLADQGLSCQWPPLASLSQSAVVGLTAPPRVPCPIPAAVCVFGENNQDGLNNRVPSRLGAFYFALSPEKSLVSEPLTLRGRGLQACVRKPCCPYRVSFRELGTDEGRLCVLGSGSERRGVREMREALTCSGGWGCALGTPWAAPCITQWLLGVRTSPVGWLGAVCGGSLGCPLQAVPRPAPPQGCPAPVHTQLQPGRAVPWAGQPLPPRLPAICYGSMWQPRGSLGASAPRGQSRSCSPHGCTTLPCLLLANSGPSLHFLVWAEAFPGHHFTG